MSDNYWDNLSDDDAQAGRYMLSYGEGPGTITRQTLAMFINNGDSVLDVGCGPGWNLDHFKEHGPDISHYRGIDYSRRFVRAANARHPQHFKFGDARDLSAEGDGSWDVVILQDVLEHINGYANPVWQALRVAKKRLIITFWRLRDVPDHTEDLGDDGWSAQYNRADWERFLDKLDIHWLHHQIEDTTHKVRDYYIIDKEIKHGK